MATIRSQELLKIITVLSAAFALVIFLDYKVYSNNGNGNIAKVTAERRLDKWNPKKDDYAEDVVYDKKSKRKLGDTLALSPIGEDRRIQVFQNIAPSVVFIDTFNEVEIAGADAATDPAAGAGVDGNNDNGAGADAAATGSKKKISRNTDKWSKWSKNNDINQKIKKVDHMKRLQLSWKKKQNRLKKMNVYGIQDSVTMLQGSGTGFVWDREGHIITNSHVVADAKQIEVSILTKKDVENENSMLFPTSLDGRTPGIDGEYHWRVVRAKVIGSDPGSDIAVIKIDVPEFDIHPVERGDDKDVMVGADCLAIGNPYGLDHTLSRGIISAKGRISHSVSGIPMKNLIQTDASMNPGNSGGPLLNSKGQVIGMNTMIMSASKASAGVGFAIPISTISEVSNILIEKGEVVRPNFGIIFDMGVQAGLGALVQNGVLIMEVVDEAKKDILIGTNMELNGSIQIGDIITSIDGVAVESDLDVYAIVNHFQPGQDMALKILHFDVMNGNKVFVEKTVIVKV